MKAPNFLENILLDYFIIAALQQYVKHNILAIWVQSIHLPIEKLL